MIVRSKAPLRISFAGGGTDVPPYPQERGGVVLSSTIDKYAYCSLTPNQPGAIRVSSLDYDVIADYRSTADLVYNGQLDLVKAAIKVMGAPAGHLRDRPARIRYRAHRIADPGGDAGPVRRRVRGMNFIEFHPDAVIVNPLRVDPDTLNELEYHLVLCYTGKTRRSARIIERQVASYVERWAEVVRALDGLKALTIQMKNALLRGHLDEFGALLDEGWKLKTGLDQAITDPEIDELYDVARRHGAIGGKLLGAGAGAISSSTATSARSTCWRRSSRRWGPRSWSSGSTSAASRRGRPTTREPVRQAQIRAARVMRSSPAGAGVAVSRANQAIVRRRPSSRGTRGV